ncbi:MAG TPA: DUF4388 domain-containing protein [Thermoanaerobaculia bacterium]|nr:DUF4388 domain-containing protein [Thermoanaerobaculia bacterium]
MFPTEEQLDQLVSKAGGDFRQVPFGVVLRWLWEQRRTCTLEIRRGRLWKRVALEHGSPVACESNLAHERFGRFLVDVGRLTDQDFSRTLSESISREMPLGEVLVESGALDAEELLRLLQQCLGKQLLDGFTWTDGQFSFPPEPLEVPAPLRVKVPQLVLTGTARFVPQAEVDSAVMTLIGTRLAAHPFPLVRVDELRLDDAQERLLASASTPQSLSDLADHAKLGMDEVARQVYALGVIGLLITEDRLQTLSQLGSVTQAFEAPSLGAPRRSGESVAAMFLAHRRRDPFDLLGVSEEAAEPAIRQRYLEFARRYAPWQHDGEEVREQARDLFLAAAAAYAALIDRERRAELLERRRRRIDQGSARRIADMIDARECFVDGLARWQKGEREQGARQITLAAELDPQNSRYRLEAARVRGELGTAAPEAQLAELYDVMRIDPTCREAFLLAADLAERLERSDEAGSLRESAPPEPSPTKADGAPASAAPPEPRQVAVPEPAPADAPEDDAPESAAVTTEEHE